MSSGLKEVLRCRCLSSGSPLRTFSSFEIRPMRKKNRCVTLNLQPETLTIILSVAQGSRISGGRLLASRRVSQTVSKQFRVWGSQERHQQHLAFTTTVVCSHSGSRCHR